MTTFSDIAVLCVGMHVGGHFYNSIAVAYNMQVFLGSDIVCFKHEVFAQVVLEHLPSQQLPLL